MGDWVNTALPIATLVLGSLLTMAGQALRDRRAAAQEQRARREGFMAGNFEVHRTAMLEMQEIVRNCYLAFMHERRRRNADGFYEYFNKNPMQDYSSEMSAMTRGVLENLERFRVASSRAERQEIRDEFSLMTKSFAETTSKIERVFDEQRVQIEGLHPFWKLYPELIYKLRLC